MDLKNKIKIQEILDHRNQQITSELYKSSDGVANPNVYTRNKSVIYPPVYMKRKQRNQSDPKTGNYTNIIGSRKMSTKGEYPHSLLPIDVLSSNKKYILAQTVKEIRRRVRKLIKRKKATIGDIGLKNVVNTYNNRTMIRNSKKAHKMVSEDESTCLGFRIHFQA